MNKKNIKSILAVLIIILILIFLVCIEINTNKEYGNIGIDNSELNIFFFNVGQAESILITNNNAKMLIDCGNNSDGKHISKFLKEQGIETYLFLAGQKGISALRKKCQILGCPIVKKYYSAVDTPSPMEAREIAEDMAEYYVNKKIDKVEIVTTRFKNMMTYFVEDWQVLPVVGVVDIHDRIADEILEPLMEFYPDMHHIVQKIVPMYMTNIFYQALLEAQASELASRMTAMSAATTNAEKMIHDLSIQYNKTRQTAITQEIIEVVSGANSLS